MSIGRNVDGVNRAERLRNRLPFRRVAGHRFADHGPLFDPKCQQPQFGRSQRFSTGGIAFRRHQRFFFAGRSRDQQAFSDFASDHGRTAVAAFDHFGQRFKNQSAFGQLGLVARHAALSQQRHHFLVEIDRLGSLRFFHRDRQIDRGRAIAGDEQKADADRRAERVSVAEAETIELAISMDHGVAVNSRLAEVEGTKTVRSRASVCVIGLNLTFVSPKNHSE